MAIAGKVAITPGGEWSVDIAYDKLVVVTFGNNVYLSIKPNTGIEPTNEEHWMLLVENVTQEQYDAIINGTTPVGNANKLGGKSASEYALAEQITNNSIWTKLTEGFDLNNALGKYRNHSGAVVDTLLNLPPTSLYLRSCEIAVEWFPSHPNNTYGEQVVTLTNGGAIEEFKRHKNGDTWGAWKQTATTADLANYLPLSGGMLSTRDSAPFALDNTSAGNIMIDFYSAGVRQGLLGFNAVNNPIFYDTNHKEHSLLHTGNKPRGSYTGNGSATYREIYTGGIGNACIIWRDGVSALVFPSGTAIFTASSFEWNQGTAFINGYITMATDSTIINEVNATYNYRVL